MLSWSRNSISVSQYTLMAPNNRTCNRLIHEFSTYWGTLYRTIVPHTLWKWLYGRQPKHILLHIKLHVQGNIKRIIPITVQLLYHFTTMHWKPSILHLHYMWSIGLLMLSKKIKAAISHHTVWGLIHTSWGDLRWQAIMSFLQLL